MAGSSIIVMGFVLAVKAPLVSYWQSRLGENSLMAMIFIRVPIFRNGLRQPLNDEDRKPWLERIRDAAYSLESKTNMG